MNHQGGETLNLHSNFSLLQQSQSTTSTHTADSDTIIIAKIKFLGLKEHSTNLGFPEEHQIRSFLREHLTKGSNTPWVPKPTGAPCQDPHGFR